MKPRGVLALLASSLVALGSVALAAWPKGHATWVVDDDGGPGVHFTDIPPAVAAADDGDRILVLAGDYSAFDVAKALTVVGQPGASVAGVVTILSAPGVVSVASLAAEALDVRGCGQAVVLDEVAAIGGKAYLGSPAEGDFVASVEDSVDVRFVDCTITGNDGNYHHALRVSNSRVEIVTSELTGTEGFDLYNSPPAVAGYGGDGMRADGDSFVQTALSALTGGRGGTCFSGFLCFGASGGSGAVVASPGRVIVTGGGYIGGDGGFGASQASYCGHGGDGISGTGQLRRSGATFVRGDAIKPCKKGTAIGLPSVVATPPDPTLERLGIPVLGFFGGPLTLRVRGDPGARTHLFLGRQPAVVPTPNVEIEQLLVPMVTIDLGHMPSKGFVDHVLYLGPELPYAPLYGGQLILAQASCDYPGGDVRRTNSMPLVLRH